MIRRRAMYFSFLLCFLAWVIGGSVRPLQGAFLPTATGDPSPARPFSRSEVQAFIDPYMARSMAAAHVPGAAIAVVKDGAILYARGYGVANLARQTPVDPEKTVFRVASVSKLLTATAVMQLADRGQVRLDADVNQYLRGFQVPATYPQPVTLSSLLTHTAGFEDRTIGRTTLSAADLPSLEMYLAMRMPERVMPPGAFYSYSNYGFGLAGGVVQAVSGQPFDRYVAREIFAPLGMDHSSFAQPLPPALTDSLATGYDVAGTGPVAAPVEYFADPPAAAMSTTAADMARFMIFQLGDGPTDQRVLSKQALGDMQSLHFRASPDADFNGMAYGYGRYQRNDVLILSKEGDVRGFASYVALFPNQHLGYFVAANTNDAGWMQDLERQLVNQFFPIPPAVPPATPPELRGSLDAFAGTYVPNRSSRSTIEKLRVLDQQIRIVDAGDSKVDVVYPNGAAVRLTRIGPLAFANVYEGVAYRWAFLADRDGRIAHFLIGNDVYDRVAWYDTRTVQLGIALAFALLFLAGLGLGLLPTGRTALGRALGAALCAMNLLFIVGLAAVFVSATATQALDYSWIAYGVPWIVDALLCLPLITTALAIGGVAGIAAAWRRHTWRPAEYRYATLVALAQLAFIPFLLHWNLLGFRV